MKKIKYVVLILVVVGGFLYYYNNQVLSIVVSYEKGDKELIFDTLEDSEIWKILNSISLDPSKKHIKSIEEEYINKGYKVDFSKLQIFKITREVQKKQEKKLNEMKKGYSKKRISFYY